MTLSVGDQAPDFELKDQHGQSVRLSSLRGRQAALVVFYPWAFTGVCGGELRELQEALDELAGSGVEVLTVSTDPMYALRAFADQQGFTFPMLSDFWPHGAVASAYGVFSQEVGIALRGSFLVDVHGVLRWSVVNGIPDARDLDDYRKAIAAL
jgi:mycoredoxin-dependent peroxiredoxin